MTSGAVNGEPVETDDVDAREMGQADLADSILNTESWTLACCTGPQRSHHKQGIGPFDEVHVSVGQRIKTARIKGRIGHWRVSDPMQLIAD